MTACGTDDKRGYLGGGDQGLQHGDRVEPGRAETIWCRAPMPMRRSRTWREGLNDLDSAIALAPDNIDLLIQKAKMVAQAA